MALQIAQISFGKDFAGGFSESDAIRAAFILDIPFRWKDSRKKEERLW